MKEATVVYPHQLFENSPALGMGRRVYIVEEPLILTHNPIHIQKLIFHKLTLDHYQKSLEERGFSTTRLSLDNCKKTAEVFERLKKDGINKIHVVDTTDFYLEKAIEHSGIERVWYDSPLFVLPKEDAVKRYIESKRFMQVFYKTLRKDKQILLDDKKGGPQGGKWSFDEENRKKLPKNTTLPDDISMSDDSGISHAKKWASYVDAEVYGVPGCWLPYTRKQARIFLEDFLENRLTQFGKYEDAMTTEGVRLFHSALSPLMNVGLLTPGEVIEAVLSYGKKTNAPINSIEGFVRQVLGWREFIRAAYESDGVTMRSKNFWGHARNLPKKFWEGDTGVDPLDISIKRALKYGYTHHIERLMVLGNFMLLSKIHPDQVYKWFMGMYLDAYDWVMVPNVYGMSQFADGGVFATKPYISGSNYLRKMSDYPQGEWEDLWTALYWNFISSHKDFFESNHRLSMMPRLLEKMDKKKRERYFKIANNYLE